MGSPCQHRLPPLDSADEREENVCEPYTHPQSQCFLPIERRNKGDENEPSITANEHWSKENWLSVLSSTPKPIQHCTLLKVELMSQGRSKGESDIS